jgi:hypothetical protein
MLVHDIDHAVAEAPQEEEGANQSKGHKVIAAICGAKEGRLVHKKGEIIAAQKLSGFSNIGEPFFSGHSLRNSAFRHIPYPHSRVATCS